MKIEPSANLRVVARRFREMYVAFRDEGFTDDQAMHMIDTMIYATSVEDGEE